MQNKMSNILWGLAFVVLGLCYAGNAFELWNFQLFFRGWWTLLIIIPCLVSIIKKEINLGNTIGLIVGTILLLSAQGIINEAMLSKLIFPIILILLGISIIFKK